jgi:hypothetical protein
MHLDGEPQRARAQVDDASLQRVPFIALTDHGNHLREVHLDARVGQGIYAVTYVVMHSLRLRRIQIPARNKEPKQIWDSD